MSLFSQLHDLIGINPPGMTPGVTATGTQRPTGRSPKMPHFSAKITHVTRSHRGLQKITGAVVPAGHLHDSLRDLWHQATICNIHAFTPDESPPRFPHDLWHWDGHDLLHDANAQTESPPHFCAVIFGTTTVPAPVECSLRLPKFVPVLRHWEHQHTAMRSCGMNWVTSTNSS